MLYIIIYARFCTFCSLYDFDCVSSDGLFIYLYILSKLPSAYYIIYVGNDSTTREIVSKLTKMFCVPRW